MERVITTHLSVPIHGIPTQIKVIEPDFDGERGGITDPIPEWHLANSYSMSLDLHHILFIWEWEWK